MSDFNDEEYTQMVCVEPGVVSRYTELQPNEVWRLCQRLTVSEME